MVLRNTKKRISKEGSVAYRVGHRAGRLVLDAVVSIVSAERYCLCVLGVNTEHCRTHALLH